MFTAVYALWDVAVIHSADAILRAGPTCLSMA